MKNKEKIQLLVFLSLIFGTMAIILAIDVGVTALDAKVALYNVSLICLGEITISAVAVCIWRVFCWYKSHRSFGVLDTAVRLVFFTAQKKQAMRNVQQVNPPLCYFLYCVLRRNKDILGINPGADMQSLSPNKPFVSFNDHAIYFTYDLITASAPEQDVNVLKNLINQLIVDEITNYGIDNLPIPFGPQSSVYLDRLTYDEVRHRLSFRVLYVCSNRAAAAFNRALNRDRPKTAMPEMEVYDDELC